MHFTHHTIAPPKPLAAWTPDTTIVVQVITGHITTIPGPWLQINHGAVSLDIHGDSSLPATLRKLADELEKAQAFHDKTQAHFAAELEELGA